MAKAELPGGVVSSHVSSFVPVPVPVIVHPPSAVTTSVAVRALVGRWHRAPARWAPDGDAGQAAIG
jgi:hypothetical protein